jgi:hypothetical protein
MQNRNYRDYRDYQPGLLRRLAYAQYNDLNNLINYTTRQSTNSYLNLPRINIGELFIEQDFSYENLTMLQSSKQGLISNKLLEKSSVIYHKNNNEFFCVICQSKCINTVIRTLSCKHSFHINCIDKWFTENKTCPICKFEI